MYPCPTIMSLTIPFAVNTDALVGIIFWIAYFQVLFNVILDAPESINDYLMGLRIFLISHLVVKHEYVLSLITCTILGPSLGCYVPAAACGPLRAAYI